MKIGVPKETAEGERRVALVPDVIKALTAKGIEVAVEPGAGEGASHPDSEYTDAGAKVGDDEAGFAGKRSRGEEERRRDGEQEAQRRQAQTEHGVLRAREY